MGDRWGESATSYEDRSIGGWFGRDLRGEDIVVVGFAFSCVLSPLRFSLLLGGRLLLDDMNSTLAESKWTRGSPFGGSMDPIACLPLGNGSIAEGVSDVC